MKSYTNYSTFIVDDDPYWSNMLQHLLSEMNIDEVTVFDNGNDCIHRMYLRPTVVFLDFQMEGLDGLEVLQKIKRHSPETQVVFCTAHEDLGVAMQAMDYGSFDFLLKENVSRKELGGMISRMMDDGTVIGTNNPTSSKGSK